MRDCRYPQGPHQNPHVDGTDGTGTADEKTRLNVVGFVKFVCCHIVVVAAAAIMSFVQVSDTNDADKEVVDLPLEKDGTLLLSTLHAQYPDACGLKYVAPDNGRTRALRLAEDKLHPPGDDGWGDIVYFCSFNKGNNFFLFFSYFTRLLVVYLCFFLPCNNVIDVVHKMCHL